MAEVGTRYDLRRLDRHVPDGADWDSYHAIRRSALWDERGRSNYDDRHADEYHPENHPLLLRFEGRAIGTTRLDDRRDGSGIVRLVAITDGLRGRGHGRILGERIEHYALRLGIETLLVNAARSAEGFYTATGWHKAEWDPSELIGVAIDCIQMRKDLIR